MLQRRHKNSGRQNIGTRFASHCAWICAAREAGYAIEGDE